MQTRRRVPFAVCLVTVLLTALSAPAGYLEYEGSGLHETVTIYHPDFYYGYRTLSAGQNLFTYEGEELVTYCVDLFQSLSSTYVTEQPVSFLNDGARDDGTAAAYLYMLAESVSTDAEAAAMQAAIWEVVFEDDDNDYDILDGDFRLSCYTSQEILDEAQDLLDQLGGDLSIPATTSVLHSPYKQDMLIQRLDGPSPSGDAEVPDPATMILVPLGVMATAAYTRRRKGQPASADKT